MIPAPRLGCLPNCREPHDPGEPPLCAAELAAVPWPTLTPGEWTQVRVGLVRDGVDGQIRVALTADVEMDELAAGPPEAARALAFAILAAADAERVN